MSEQTIPDFASENCAGVHPRIFQALAGANHGHVPSYGSDHYTEKAVDLIKELFGAEEVYFAMTGTGANNFALSCATSPFHAIYCTDVAHLNVAESTAPESLTGCRVYAVPSDQGKIDIDALRRMIKRRSDIHHPQPKIVSLTQPTEYGTVYTMDEMRQVKELCSEHGMLLHVDGARFYNAAAHLNISLRELGKNAGVDLLTLGGTKSGMMFGEAVLFFNADGSDNYRYYLKRSMQLASKNRFIAVQFSALLENNLWKDIAVHTNGLAQTFAKAMAALPGVKIARPVQTNAVFVRLSKARYLQWQRVGRFHYWDEDREEARFIFSFDNEEEEIMRFAGGVTAACGDE